MPGEREARWRLVGDGLAMDDLGLVDRRRVSALAASEATTTTSGPVAPHPRLMR